MSGFCAVMRTDGLPIERKLLESMTDVLRLRGPDGRDTWMSGHVGLGQSLLHTQGGAQESARQLQSIEGVWIAADARIDGQDALRAQLKASGRAVDPRARDTDLIVHAYLAWGESCVAHLIGDFSFALWDGTARRLFCARDHFGVKPFFYARVGPYLLVSNALDCIRAHPLVSNTLNDLAIADFLLFDSNQDPATTSFKDIFRLPPAHALIQADRAFDVRRFWSLPTDLGIRYRAQRDYVEHFSLLLEQAVEDRMRAPRVSIQMSGGLDSTAVGAMAKRVADRSSGPCELQAHSIVYDRIIPDEERHFADLAANAIGIPIRYLAGDDYRLYEKRATALTPSEPFHSPDHAVHLDAAASQASFARVVLTGWDGDTLLAEPPRRFIGYLFERGQYLKAIAAMVQYGWFHRRVVPHSWLARLRPAKPGVPVAVFPEWINPSLQKRFDLRQRWQEFTAHAAESHPIRPYAYRIYDYLANHSFFFSSFDTTLTGQHLEYRHPFFDLRLVEYCLSLPPLPWCDNKEILRRSMAGRLPDAVRNRPKTPLAGFPYVERLREPQEFPDVEIADTRIYNYVLCDRIPRGWIGSDINPVSVWSNLRLLSLNNWLNTVSAEPDIGTRTYEKCTTS